MNTSRIPSVTIIGTNRAQIGAIECAVGEAAEGYVLRAVLTAEAAPLAVLEGPEDQLVFVSEDGPEVALHPRLEGASAEGFDAQFFERLLKADEDVLGEQVLAAGEPSYEAVVGMLPRVVDETFVGDPRVEERAIIQPDGSIEGMLEPLTALPWEELRARGQWGLVDPSLPLPVMRVELDDGAFAEQTVAATVAAHGELQVLTRRRRVQREREEVEYLARPEQEAPTGEEEFYAAILRAWRHAQDSEKRLMCIEGGDEQLTALALSSMQMADLTMRGCLPRYGIGRYDQWRHHGFPPTTLHLALCLLEWGDFARAEDVLGCYLDAFVNADGTFDYYGPAVAEYGQILALAARYVELTGDLRWWTARQNVLRAIWTRLLELRRESLADEEAPPEARGLIAGLPEADYHEDEQQWQEYYFAGDAWVCRGLTEMARLLRRTGQEVEADAITSEAEAYKADLAAATAEAKVETDSGVFVAPGPAQRTPFEHMTEDRHASYCNYRYFAEMVSAGIVDDETVAQILAYRRSHGGELLGMTRFTDHLDDWPVMNYARAMIEMGEVEYYLLLLYSHLAQHQVVGWLSAPEQVTILPDEHGLRRKHAGQVVPCQVTAPLMLRWALAYELRDEEVLLVAPAVSHRWVSEGEGLRVNGLPTRWGQVDLALRGNQTSVEVRLSLPEGFAADVRVRIPAPPGRTPREVQVGGRSAENLADEGRVVLLPPGTRGEVSVVAAL